MQLKLISFKLCPFVQQVSVVLNWKNVDYGLEYIELADPPDWFLKLSPFKQVPILLVKDKVLFESTAINEYIEEAYEKKLHPDDLILKAKNRSWIAFCNQQMCSASASVTGQGVFNTSS